MISMCSDHVCVGGEGGMSVYTFIYYISFILTTPSAPPLHVEFKVKNLTAFD